MADLAQQLPSENEMDSEFKIAADLAKERAGDRLVSITERRRDTIMTPDDSSGRGVAEHARPSFGAPSNSLYEDDASAGRARGSASQQGALDEPSPAFVQGPEVAQGDQAVRSTPEEADDAALPPQQEAGVPEQPPDDNTQPAPEYSDQFNKSPETTGASLVDDGNSALGIQPATAGITGGTSSPNQESVSEEGQNGEGANPQQPGMVDRAKNAAKSGINNRMGGVMGLVNRKKIAELEKQVNDKNQQLKKIDDDIKKYKRKNITPLQWKRRAAVLSDIVRVITTYEVWILGLTAGIWWILVIGVILDVSLVWTGVGIFYGIGIIKGPLRKSVDFKIKRHEIKIKTMKQSRKPIEQEIQQLRQQQFQLTQVFQNQAAEEGQTPQGGPPTVGGISLAS